jgi:hypothetical protein
MSDQYADVKSINENSHYQITEEDIKEIYESTRQFVHTISPMTALIVTAKLMEVVGKYKTMSGRQKKDLIIKIIMHQVEQSNMSTEDKIVMNLMIQFSIPHAIDLAINIGKGRHDFSLGDAGKTVCFCL